MTHDKVYADLFQYGMIKKIEHFWKGLTSEKTQISALPPAQYGDRFYNFVEGITMSQEEAHRDAHRRDEEMAEAARSSHHRKSIPPMPDHQPPAPPPGARSPEAREMVEMNAREAHKTEQEGATEKQVPDRTLRTSVAQPNQRDSLIHEPILPVVEEAGEAQREGRGTRPSAPAKGHMPPPSFAPPPIPPKGAPPAKPDTADSGYAAKPSRESMNKSLPPLPKNEADDSSVRMVA